ncbi:hypothetical protein AVEN_143579-1 [Araneus ventricosus]|uniref:Uncharacterized protein n=1 Tax=Araneus ventricosus TaxID=182803 RepID=A0A4Y2AMX5_ARAVE|nr:hypothetical protein AVEN_143579-1 [Araneus ventricosus]
MDAFAMETSPGPGTQWSGKSGWPSVSHDTPLQNFTTLEHLKGKPVSQMGCHFVADDHSAGKRISIGRDWTTSPPSEAITSFLFQELHSVDSRL